MSLNNLKYYNSKKSTGTFVSWNLLDKNDKIIDGEKGYVCFSPITYSAIERSAKKINVYRELSVIPYSKKIIERWVSELNELGFPCSVNFTPTIANFLVNLQDFEFKSHLTITLQLIRALFESYICYIPEVYFDLLESGEEKNKFFALQLAHKIVTSPENYGKLNGFPNTNHMVTYKNNFKEPIDQKTFWERIKKSKNPVYSEKYSNINNIWRN